MRSTGVLVLIVAALLGLCAAPVSADVTRYEGEIDGAKYRVMVPSNWNGTLVVWSHGTYGREPDRIALTSQVPTEDWLLSRGYALGASKFKHVVGWSIEDGLRDQIKLLDWFEREIGKPRTTISAGESAGAMTATVLAERNPRRFDGVMTLCGVTGGGVGYWNSGLDMTFALKTLLNADIDLVRIADPAANEQKVFALIENGDRARVALAAALADIPGWFDPTAPRPSGVDEQVSWMAFWAKYFRSSAAGLARWDMEQWAGGNPSWNIGVDYRAVLARSSELPVVKAAYAAAGLDLDADLDRLARAPRIAPDPAALAYLARTSVPYGFNPWPVVTVHNAADGLAPLSNDRVYADRVRNRANLRQYQIGRAGHCVFTASEEIAAFQTLAHRMQTGHWPATDPGTLNVSAATHGPEFQQVRNLLTGQSVTTRPAFEPHNPGRFPRPF